ncbi:unnamed protein product [Musa textilis]
MMGSFLSRGLILVFGYAYPAYECYKTVELNKPEIEQLLFWCQYWILVASLAILERFVDVLFSWLPMYCEAKLALYIYLWYPKMRQQSDELPSPAPPAATRASASPVKNQPEEQLTSTTKTGVLPPESGPDVHASQTANPPPPAEKPAQAADASSPTPKEAAIRATRGRLRKRPPIGHA